MYVCVHPKSANKRMRNGSLRAKSASLLLESASLLLHGARLHWQDASLRLENAGLNLDFKGNSRVTQVRNIADASNILTKGTFHFMRSYISMPQNTVCMHCVHSQLYPYSSPTHCSF